jgi:outer membrane autotransporter protein
MKKTFALPAIIVALASLLALATHASANGFATLYWLGSNGTLWSAGNNWSTDSVGTTSTDFSTDAYVNFSATGSSNSTATDLGGDLTISSFTIDTPDAVGISGGNLTIGGDISIGSSSSNNSLQISNGVAVSAASMWAGAEVGANNNQVTVGANSTLTLTDDIYVGDNGSSNRLTITNGGAVSAFYMSAGREAVSNDNQVTVGANSTLAVTDLLDVGFHGFSNNLTITNGGAVSANYTSVGREAGSNNNAILVTSNASMLINNDLIVGEAGSSNSMTISEGGRVTSSVGYIGNNATSADNTVIVTGTNSTWTNNGILHVGYGGSNNTLTVANNGTVSTSSISIASQAGSGGTLNIGTVGGNDTGGTINAPSIAFGNGTGTINFNQSNAMAFSGNISGNGSVNKLGSGTTTLSGNNTYTGGTNIQNGTLWAQNAHAFGTGNVLVNGGTLLTTSSQESIMGSQTLSIGGNLDWTSGKIGFYNTGTSPLSGNLTIRVTGNFTASEGNKTFDFSGVEALNYGAYTLVNATTVSAIGTSFVAAHGPYTTLYGNFTTTNSTIVYTVTGAVSGGTDIRNNGGPNTPVVANYNVTGATVTIGVDNTVNALTFSSSAPLTIQADGQLTVTSGTLAVQTGSSVVSGGVLNTTGNLNKTGTGELDLQSNTNVNGIANVVAGLLSVNGQLNANSVAVDPNATLGGAGVIVASNVVVNGNLSPGNSPGTLSVVGNLVLTGANSTIIEIASPTNFDRIVVTGTATLGGTLNAVGYGGYTIAPGSRFDFLQAGSIVGAYDSIVAPEGLRARFLSSGTVGTLLFGPGSYVPMAINQNQRNVAKALDTFIVATNGDRLAVSIALDSLTTAQFPAAFDQIMPGFYESLANIAIEQAFNQTQMLNQRISSVRLGAAGFQAIGGISQPLVHDKNGKSAADAKDASSVVESATATNWNSWALGTGMFSRTTNLGSLQNYNNDAGGFLVGSDYRWSENFVTGLYAGYDYSYAEYNGGGSTKGNSFNFGTYASYAKDGYYADAVIGGGYTGFQTKRSIEFSTIDRTASADPNSGQFTAGLNLGKDFEVAKFTLGPIIGAQYTYAGIGSFTESGAESLDLSLGQQNANSLRSTLGGRIAYTWNLNQKIALIPEVRMFWQHEFLNNPRNINASLDSGNGPSFGYETTDPYRDSVFAGAGVTAQFGKNLSGSLFYNINFGSQTYQSNMVSAGLNFSF